MKKIPLFPLGLVLLPGMTLPLHIFEARYRQMISYCLAEDAPFGVVFYDGKTMRTAGCLARVVKVTKRYDDGRMNIVTEGEQRFVIRELIEDNAYAEAQVAFFDDDTAVSGEEAAAVVADSEHLLEDLAGSDLSGVSIQRLARENPKALSFALAAQADFTHAEQQRFLEMTSSLERLEKAVSALTKISERNRLTLAVQQIIGGNGHPPVDLVRRLGDLD